MLLSVVVVNWNSIEDLRDCLASLRQQTHRELEVIVIDNGSSDGSPAMVRDQFPDFVLLSQSENLGFAEACNRGIEASSGEWVAMLNNDAIAKPDWAEHLVAAASSTSSDCGMLQSLMLYKLRPNTINSTGVEMTPLGFGRDRDEGKPRSSSQEIEPIFCPTAGAAGYRRSMLEAIRLSVGYFDRTHFMYYEDVDLGWRARLAGFTAYYVPRSVVYHRWHGSSDRHGPTWLEILADTNRLRTLIKNASISFLARHVVSILNGAFRLIRTAGLRGIPTLGQAVARSVTLRKEVSTIARVPRRDIDQKWCGRNGR